MHKQTLLQHEQGSLRGHARFNKEVDAYKVFRDECGEVWLPLMTVVDRVVPTVLLRWSEPHHVAIKIIFTSIGLPAYRRGRWPFTPPEIRFMTGQFPPALQACMDGNRILILDQDWSPALQLSQIAMILGCWLNETIVIDHQPKTAVNLSRVDLCRRKSCPSFDTVTFAEENSRIISKRKASDAAWDDCDGDYMCIAYLEDVPQNYSRCHWHASTLTTLQQTY